MRRAHYNRFSRFYDRFVALHSRDRQDLARRFLAGRLPADHCGSVLDLCTGTATLVLHLRERVGGNGRVVGVDFSRGMLKVSQEKTRSFGNIHLVEAGAELLPFLAESFDAVICSYAFYELKGAVRQNALREIVRVLRPKGVFLMMEHAVPRNLPVKALFYLRLTLIGAGWPNRFLRHEREILEEHFQDVETFTAPAGRSKVMICWK